MENLSFKRPSVVISGSFHRDPEGLEWLWRELEANGCRILSPSAINFIDTSVEIVKTAHDNGMNIDELEKFHLRAIRDADLIWLHAPDGHIGISTSFEIGFALALGKPVFARTMPDDAMLQTQITIASSVFQSFRQLAERMTDRSRLH